MPRTREEIHEERRRLRADYRHLCDEVESLLFRHDPMGINFETNTDEYDPEVGTILPRLRSCNCGEDVCRVTHEEFVRWFGDDAGPSERYSRIGEEIWVLYQQFLSAEPGPAPNVGPAKPPDNSEPADGPPSVR